MDWLEILNGAFELILLSVISLATVYVITWLKAKKQELLVKTEDETAKKYIEMLDKTVCDCVLATKQTFVDTLKKDGVFDEAAQKEAFQLTYNSVMSILTDDAREYLNEAVTDLNTYITTKIEAQVSATK
jgi:hypothetical protein